MTEVERAVAVEGWQERFNRVANACYFRFSPHIFSEVVEELTVGEYARLVPKLELIARHAERLAVGMLKGTIKYAGDDHSVATWKAEEEDDSVDSVNYRLLRQDAERRQAELPF